MVSDGAKIIPIDANHMSAFISLCYPTDKNLLIYRGRQDAVFSFDFEQYKLYLKKFVINNPDDTSSIYNCLGHCKKILLNSGFEIQCPHFI